MALNKTLSRARKGGTGRQNQSATSLSTVYKIKQGGKGEGKASPGARGMQEKGVVCVRSPDRVFSAHPQQVPADQGASRPAPLHIPGAGVSKNKPFGKSKAEITCEFSVLLLAPVRRALGTSCPPSTRAARCLHLCCCSHRSGRAGLRSVVSSYQSLSLINLATTGTALHLKNDFYR